MIRSIPSEGNKGFTLIEVLITMAIFSVGVLAVASMQYWSVRNTASGDIMTMAANLARAQMETLKNEPDVTTLANGSSPNNPMDANGNPGGSFTRTWVITNPLGGSTSRQIDVTVAWKDSRKISHSVVLTSISRGNGT